MEELKVLHFTDVHENISRLEAIAKFMEEKKDIDLVIQTGDLTGYEKPEDYPYTYESEVDAFIEKNKDKNIPLEEVLASHSIDPIKLYDGTLRETLDKLPSAERKEILEKFNTQAKFIAGIKEIYSKHVARLKPYLKKIKSLTKYFIGVAGNHDLNLIYGELKDIIDFVDITPGTNVYGRTGVRFKVKGMINSYELSPTLSKLVQTGLLVNWMSGLSTNMEGIDKELIKQIQKKEKERMGYDKPDIMLLHKFSYPKEHKFRENIDYNNAQGSELAYEYQQMAHSYAGHWHEPRVVVINGKMQINPGPNHVAITTYNKNKELTGVDIYEIIKA